MVRGWTQRAWRARVDWYWWHWSVYLLPLQFHTVTDMVSDSDGYTARLDSQLVASWPSPMDIDTDIFMPGTVATFKSQLQRALISRELYSVISERAPTMREIAAENPAASPQEVLEAFEATILKRPF